MVQRVHPAEPDIIGLMALVRLALHTHVNLDYSRFAVALREIEMSPPRPYSPVRFPRDTVSGGVLALSLVPFWGFTHSQGLAIRIPGTK
jgi:hypothetical protein